MRCLYCNSFNIPNCCPQGDLAITLTVRDVYGKPYHELKAPEGYRFTGEFRTSDTECWFLNMDDLSPCRGFVRSPYPRLILKKLPTRKRVTIELPSTVSVKIGDTCQIGIGPCAYRCGVHDHTATIHSIEDLP